MFKFCGLFTSRIKRVGFITLLFLVLSVGSAFAILPVIAYEGTLMVAPLVMAGLTWLYYQSTGSGAANPSNGDIALEAKALWINGADLPNASPPTQSKPVAFVKTYNQVYAEVTANPTQYPVLKAALPVASTGANVYTFASGIPAGSPAGAVFSGRVPVVGDKFIAGSGQYVLTSVAISHTYDTGSPGNGASDWDNIQVVSTYVDAYVYVGGTDLEYRRYTYASATAAGTASDFAAKIGGSSINSAAQAELAALISKTGLDSAVVKDVSDPSGAFSAPNFTPPAAPTTVQVAAAVSLPASGSSGGGISQADVKQGVNDGVIMSGLKAAVDAVKDAATAGWGALVSAINAASSAISAAVNAVTSAVNDVKTALTGVKSSTDAVKTSVDAAATAAAVSATSVKSSTDAVKSSTDSVRSSVDSASSAASAAATAAAAASASSALDRKAAADALKASVDAAALAAGSAASAGKASTDAVKASVDGVTAAVKAIPAGSGGSSGTGGLSKSDTTQAVSDALNASPAGSGTGNPANGEYDKEVVGPDKKSIGSRITSFIGSSPIGTLVRGVTLTASGTPTLAFRAFSRDCTMDFAKWETLLRGIGTAMLAITNCYSIFLIFRRED